MKRYQLTTPKKLDCNQNLAKTVKDISVNRVIILPMSKQILQQKHPQYLYMYITLLKITVLTFKTNLRLRGKVV